MLDLFKNWISSILAIGILFTIIRMILPNSNLKKYIYSLIGIITIIVIMNPVVSMIKKTNMSSLKKIFLDATSSIDNPNINYTNISNYEDVNKNNVKETFKNMVEEDIKSKLNSNIENNVDVSIDITDTYNIENINITLYGDTSFDIVSFVCNEYDVDKKYIKLKKGG